MTNEMTNQEAAKILHQFANGLDGLSESILIGSIDLTIEALGQEPCEDAVSRSEFEKRIKPYDTDDKMDKALYNFAHNILISCPSVQPQTVDWDAMIEEIKLSTTGMMELFDDENYGRYGMFEDDILDIINKYRNGEKQKC